MVKHDEHSKLSANMLLRFKIEYIHDFSNKFWGMKAVYAHVDKGHVSSQKCLANSLYMLIQIN